MTDTPSERAVATIRERLTPELLGGIALRFGSHKGGRWDDVAEFVRGSIAEALAPLLVEVERIALSSGELAEAEADRDCLSALLKAAEQRASSLAAELAALRETPHICGNPNDACDNECMERAYDAVERLKQDLAAELAALRAGQTEMFPRGRLNAADEGAVQLGVAVDQDVVVLAFPKPVAWVGLPAEQAEELAKTLAARAAEARRNRQ